MKNSIDDIASEIRLYVRSGFCKPDELIELFCEEIEMDRPGELDEDTIIKIVTDEFNSLKIESQTWAEVTDCDKIDPIFDELNELGII